MLETLDGTRIERVAHEKKFLAVVEKLGTARTAAVREHLDRLIDDMEPDRETGNRKFSSSYLGSELTPWPEPLSYLYEIAWEIEGTAASEDYVQEQAGLIFGQFVWECIMNRDESWVFYDPNLDPRDPNREITGKVYFERSE